MLTPSGVARSVACAVALAGASLVVAVLGPAAHAQDSPQGASVAGRLRASDAETRRDAVQQIAAMGDAAAAPLVVPLLEDPAEVVRATAAGTLGRLRARDAVGPLVARLGREKRPYVRKELAYALGAIGDRAAVAPLVVRLGAERDKEARAAAATALGEIGDPAAATALRDRLRDKEAFVRREAVRALGLVGDRISVPALVELLAGDPETDVRRHAAEALGRLGDERARGALTAATRHSDPYVAAAALEALEALDRAAGGQGQGGRSR